MISAAWFGVIVTIVVHFALTIWWASATTTTLKYLKESVKEGLDELKIMKETYVKKEDLISMKASQEAMWRKIDKIQAILGPMGQKDE